MDTSSIPGLELIQVADVVAREKSIEREEVMLAMEEAIQKAGRAKYGLDRDIRVTIDRKSGAIALERWMEVVEEVEDEATQMSTEEGSKLSPPLAIGEFLRQPLPPIEFGRIAAQTAKQVISQKSVMPNVFASLLNIKIVLVKLLWARSSGRRAILLRLILAALKR